MIIGRAAVLALALGAWLRSAVAAPPVEPPEPQIAAAGAEGDYLRAAHKRVHAHWTNNFLLLAGRELPPSSPLNKRSLACVVRLAITPDGRVASARITSPSGNADFDAAALDVVRSSAPFPAPPGGLLSDDGNLQLEWTLARDARRCSGVALVKQEDPLEIAIPKLVQADRHDEALRRVAATRAAGVDAALTILARAWLAAALSGPTASVRAAAALDAAGDRAGEKGLKAALGRPEMAAEAAAALRRRGVAICPLVRANLTGNEPMLKEAAARALAATAEEECAGDLAAVLANKGVPPRARAAAAAALGPLQAAAAKEALAGSAHDAMPAVRAAVLLAGVRPDAGRGAVVRLIKYLGDPAPEIRAAAAVGVLRAGQDTALSELAFLTREQDPRPAEAAAEELAKLSSPESARFLAKLLKHANLRVRLAAARALARRKDAAALGGLRPLLDPKVEPELRGAALVAADEGQLNALREDERLGLSAYRALLAGGHRAGAADWLLTHLLKLPPVDRIEALADWLLP